MKYRKLSELTKLENNPRTITKEDFEILKKSISDNKDYFEARPLILSNRTGQLVIIGGNQRYEASKALGLDEVPTYLLENLTEEKEREIIIRDNVNNGEMDWDKLANEWEQEKLEEWGVKLPKDWGQEEAVEDEAPEVSTEPAISKLGEVYQLGRHRVMCGDSTKIEDVQLLMDGQKADLILTDPPYGVAYIGKTSNSLKIDNDSMKPEEMKEFWIKAFTNMALVTKNGGSYYCCSSQGGEMMMMMMALFDSGFLVKQQIIWKKNTIVMGHSDYQFQHEPLFYGWKKDGSHKFYGDRTQSSVWEINKPSANREHPTMKPIELFITPIRNSSKEGDIVLDLFGGSGTTIISCEQTGRNGYVAEIDPRYADVIRKRYAKFVYPDRWEKEWESLTPKI